MLVEWGGVPDISQCDWLAVQKREFYPRWDPNLALGSDIDYTEVTVCAKRHVFFQDLYLNLHTAPAAACFPSLTQPLNTTQVTFIWMRATSDIKTNFSIMFDKRRNNKIEDSWASVCTFPCPGIALNDGNHILLPDFEKKMNSKEVYNKAPCSFSVLYEVSMKWT